MNPITRRQALAGAATTALVTASESFAMTQPDLVIVNARVTTLDRTNPEAQAVAIRDAVDVGLLAVEPAQVRLHARVQAVVGHGEAQAQALQQRIQRGQIQSLFGRGDGEQPLLYLVNGSKVPGIFNLGGDLGYFSQHIRSRDRERLRRYAHDCIDLMYSINNYHEYEPLVE